MTIDAMTGSKIESCRDAARACGEALVFLHGGEGDAGLEATLGEAARVCNLSADCLERLPDLRDMAIRVCVEVCERTALACAPRDDLAACAEALAACAAICSARAEIDMMIAPLGTEIAVASPIH